MHKTAPHILFFLCFLLCFSSSGWSASDKPHQENALEERIWMETAIEENPFAIAPHKPNYLLPVTYNSAPNEGPFSDNYPDGELNHEEVHFQISLKVPVWRGFWNGRGDLSFAYTNRSWWQAYNKDVSSPFRETNHEPEVILSYLAGWDFGAAKLTHLQLGLNHQSNGRGGSLSRSWNRICLTSIWDLGENTVLSVMPWYRLPEEKKDSPSDTRGDDNPDIHNYMGYGEILLVHKEQDHTVSLLFRNNLRGSDNKGAVQLDWSFPLYDRLRGYVQYFNGYGESLVDYNAAVNRIGIGVILTDWL